MGVIPCSPGFTDWLSEEFGSNFGKLCVWELRGEKMRVLVIDRKWVLDCNVSRRPRARMWGLRILMWRYDGTDGTR